MALHPLPRLAQYRVAFPIKHYYQPLNPPIVTHRRRDGDVDHQLAVVDARFERVHNRIDNREQRVEEE